MNLNTNQILAITIAVLSVLSGATAQLTDIFGAYVAKDIVSVAGLVTAILSSILAVVTSQGAQIKAVAAMPGVEKLTVNAKANQTLAQAAVSDAPSDRKIEALPSVEAAVANIAKGG